MLFNKRKRNPHYGLTLVLPWVSANRLSNNCAQGPTQQSFIWGGLLPRARSNVPLTLLYTII